MEVLGQYQEKTMSGEAVRVSKGEEIDFTVVEEQKGMPLQFRGWGMGWRDWADGTWPVITAKRNTVLLFVETVTKCVNISVFDEEDFHVKYSPIPIIFRDSIPQEEVQVESKFDDCTASTAGEDAVTQLEQLGDLGFGDALLALEKGRTVIMQSGQLQVRLFGNDKWLEVMHVGMDEVDLLHSIPTLWVLDKTWRIVPKT